MIKDDSKIPRHELANSFTPIRVRFEKLLLDHSEGRLKHKSDGEILKEALALIKETIVQIDDIMK